MIYCRKYKCGCGNHNRIKFEPSLHLNIGVEWDVTSLQEEYIINYESLPDQFYLDEIYAKSTRWSIQYFIEPKP